LGRSLALEKPSTMPTNSFTYSFTHSSLNLCFIYSSLDLLSIAIKNASGLSIPGLTVLWPNKRKLDDGLVNRGLGNKGVDKSYIVLIVKGRLVKGETLSG
jgi:hypothetical protein